MIKHKIVGVTVVFFISAVFTLISFAMGQISNIRATSAIKPKYIIDAGHGLPDGGAVGSDGTTEQELNLALAQALSRRLKANKINHILTREDENSIFSEGESIHEKKVSDIRNRIIMANNYSEACFLSIHMNTFSEPSVYGIQVFYSEKTKAMAINLQNEINQKMQPEHTKSAKPIPQNVYLFSHIENPAILIECGFISNQEELSKLKQEEYRNNLATVIIEAIEKDG